MLLDKFFTTILKFIYLQYYPLDKNLIKSIQDTYGKNAKTHIAKLNKIRVNNVKNVLWSNAGTVLALFLTILALLIAIVPIPKIEKLEIKEISLINLVVVILFLIILPITLRRIINRLSPQQYAELSLSGLNQSEILSFIAYKNCMLCISLFKSININDSNLKIFEKINFGENILPLDFEDDARNRQKLKSSSKLYMSSIEGYFSRSYHEINKCKALKANAIKLLNILPTEFSHHTMKFSPYFFENHVIRLIRYFDSIYNEATNLTCSNLEINRLFEKINASLDDIFLKRYSFLTQLIKFPSIHKVLIGMSSITSTSGSLKIFIQGLSDTVNHKKNENNMWRKECFRALINRSKSHYGFDLLILLENYLLKRSEFLGEDFKSIINALHAVKFEKRDLDDNERVIIKNLSQDFRQYSNKSKKSLEVETLKDWDDNLSLFFEQNESDELSRNYIIIIGYSRTAREFIQNLKAGLKEKNIIIFIIKENTDLMLDTRLLRHELNATRNGIKGIRQTFTGDDRMILNSIKKDDNVLFLAGAEAYDKKREKLYHTNKYEIRITSIISKLNERKVNLRFYIVAQTYKVFKDLLKKENDEITFRHEIFTDHYDKMDIYNLKNLKIDKYLLTELECIKI